MEKCFLCNESYITTNTGADIEIIDGNKLNIDYNGFQVPDINIEINFCPICGRKLGGGDNIKYKIGDVVRIKDNLQEDEVYGDCYVTEKMLKFRGAIDIIENIDDDGDFYLADKNNPFAWHKNMIELIETKNDEKIKDNLQEEEEEEYEYEFKNTKEYMFTVKLTTGEYIKIKGNQVIDMPEVIAQRIENKEDIIVFGFTGVKRELIEWYTITEVFE